MAKWLVACTAALTVRQPEEAFEVGYEVTGLVCDNRKQWMALRQEQYPLTLP